ncbi:serine/threonine protein kinase [Streptomyces yunnanensis]|uniref:Serine/threonine protein kinase n=1 Tax=Streptomyces yunnanensis TaxID=156453 RepID=A0A9X8QYF1_9ACTN|nr:serine/threonine-protein kinase [Streptomyces yunnanensis]SHN07320.1 Serine/threonine protein kinase [Streptomyces yunnanensis]
MNSAGISAQGVFQALGADDPLSVGGYRLAARLGAGGMGKVYLSHTPGGRPVALKVIRPEFAEDSEFRRRFAQEVRAAERVQGLYTAPVIDSDTEGPHPWLATAYVSGPTLASAVAEHGPLPAPTMLLLTAGVAEALQVVHSAGIVHRDLKPSNVLLAADGPRVIDFGIARAADSTALTSSGVTVGTPAFMSPEQAAGRTVGPQSDVFALGQIAAFAALGRSAHGDGPSHAVLYRIVHEDPDLAGLPAELDELVRRCLAKDPDARPSLGEVLALCSAASDGTQLRRPEDWLPGALTTAIAQRYAAPSPGPTAPEQPGVPGPAVPQQPPATAPGGVQHPPTAVSAGAPAQQASMPQHSPTVPAHPQQAPAQAGPAYAPTQTAQAYGPTQTTRPTQPVAPGVPGATPVRRRKTGIVLGCVAGAVVLLTAVLVGYLGRGGSSGTSDDAKRTGPAATASRRATAPASPSDGSSTSTVPKPEIHKNVSLSDGYYLKFSDQPLVPHNSNFDDLYLSCASTASCVFGHYNTKLVLLDQGEQGSLDTCKQDTRYLPQEISVSRFSQGRQLCATTQDGLIALVTFKGQSPSTSAGHYVTLDITIWRDAVPVQNG